ncbi:MAG TPA: carbamoyltransferase HypF [Candidatus Eisenbacteria bacterium]|uniref:Carbamoyltransferase n=1 Tax=Eiseniibacteriota bacterium TaxID=2212470 RepID=A0A7V2F4M5_UNCEI|nr:carbamoyltransferase HypF [Candidatus Eisenbacteria bacterium]
MTTHRDRNNDTARVRLLVRGRVQGVGFRPSVYRFARLAGVAGHVRNSKRGVVIEIEGRRDAIARFDSMLKSEAPPLARIDEYHMEEIERIGESGFAILPSDEPGGSDALFPVDAAMCGDCLCEMLDPADRRYRYPFINCTNCGPRFTIIEGLPYDRPLTTMSDFSMDGYCEAQYRDPEDRRFHAEPISCPHCGPRLYLIGSDGGEMSGDAIEGAARLIEQGMIVAVKGLGGYHLACLATDPRAVSRLRERKKRPAKPFALMFRDIDAVARYALLDERERRLIASPEAPIVLLRRSGAGLPEEIAPQNAYVGALLPYTPIHHLLMEHFELLVMTSANYSDEPLVSNEIELAGLLGAIADAALVHDRRIAHKCDDSIFFVPAGRAVPVRRARGYVPEPVDLPFDAGRPILALGGQEKSTFAVVKGGRAFLSAHLGDLGDYRSQKNYRDELEDFEQLLEVRPDVVVHDMHPDYFTTRLAGELGRGRRIAVQHHHAHAAGVMAEHGLEGPVIAVSFDGTGYGTDGALWGSEFLIARYDRFERLAHLAYVPLAGSEAAIREPWRMALVHLHRLFGDRLLAHGSPAAALFEGLPARQVLDLAQRGFHSPPTSSMGRLFDAVSFLLGGGSRVSYEAEAAVSLEALALEAGAESRSHPFHVSAGGGENAELIDPAPLLEGIMGDIAAGISRTDIARIFHNSVAALVADTVARHSERTGIRDVVVSGGVFQNRLLCELLAESARGAGWKLHWHLLVPPNDGGVSYGQAAVAAAALASAPDRGEKE